MKEFPRLKMKEGRGPGSRRALPVAWLLAASLLTAVVRGDEEPAPEEPKFPAMVMSVDGREIDVRKLAEGRRVVVVTLKAAWCPVCQKQLLRIKKKLPDQAGCGVTYLVLSPGPASELRAIREDTGFPYPFIEDKGLAFAESLGLRMSEKEITPSIFLLRSDLSIRWMQNPRSAGYYGDSELAQVLRCAELI